MIDPRLSSALADRYRLEQEIGAGDMATVYRAEDLRHRRTVAVKVLHPALAASLGHDRFLRETNTIAGLRHPSILPLVDSGESAGFLFSVMPFVEGERLRDRFARGEPLPLAEALQFADEIANALSYAHGRGVIHGQITPDSILIENGHALVADFSITPAVGASGNAKHVVAGTALGMTLGTPHYMSPEQARGDVLDARSDLYALGCVVYEMLAGTPPFTGPTALAIMARHAIAPVPKLAALRAIVSRPVADAVERVVERALAKAPADRLPSVEEWRRALMRASSSHPAASAAPSAPTISRPPPAPAHTLLGRDASLTDAMERLRAGARVQTVTGPGGTGKSRFAIELFRRLQNDFPDGSAYVSLTAVTQAADVMPTVSNALGIAEAHGRSAVTAIATVLGHGRVLLLLDDMEHARESAADIAELVSQCTGVCVITTSRAPLAISVEHELVLPPLTLPDAHGTPVDEVPRAAAVELFVQRAVTVQPAFALTTANSADVAAICVRLDGSPLALELAAARLRLFEPAALRQQLDDAIDPPTANERDEPAGQRTVGPHTLRATIAWSASLLDDAEQQLLRRLSVFANGWTVTEMEAVCYAVPDRSRALNELRSLVDTGLVREMDAGERYDLLEPIRDFAAASLAEHGEAESMQRAHAMVYRALAEDVQAGITGTTQLAAMQRARRDNANLMAAIRWFTGQAPHGRSSFDAGSTDAVEHGLLLCGALYWFWHIGGQHVTARASIDALMPMARDRAPSRGRARSLLASGMMSMNAGEMERGTDELARALADARAVADDALLAEAHMCAGYGHMSVGHMEESGAALDEAIACGERAHHDFLRSLSMSMKGLQLFVCGALDAGFALATDARKVQMRIGDDEGGGLSLSFLAQMTAARGEVGRAFELYGQAIASFTRVGDRPELARMHSEIGWTALGASRLAVAREAFRRSLRVYDEVGSARGIGLAFTGLAAADAADGRAERAVTIAAAADALCERTGVIVGHPMGADMAGKLDAARTTIGQELLDALVAAGRAMSPRDVLAMLAR